MPDYLARFPPTEWTRETRSRLTEIHERVERELAECEYTLQERGELDRYERAEVAQRVKEVLSDYHSNLRERADLLSSLVAHAEAHARDRAVPFRQDNDLGQRVPVPELVALELPALPDFSSMKDGEWRAWLEGSLSSVTEAKRRLADLHTTILTQHLQAEDTKRKEEVERKLREQYEQFAPMLRDPNESSSDSDSGDQSGLASGRYRSLTARLRDGELSARAGHGTARGGSGTARGGSGTARGHGGALVSLDAHGMGDGVSTVELDLLRDALSRAQAEALLAQQNANKARVAQQFEHASSISAMAVAHAEELEKEREHWSVQVAQEARMRVVALDALEKSRSHSLKALQDQFSRSDLNEDVGLMLTNIIARHENDVVEIRQHYEGVIAAMRKSASEREAHDRRAAERRLANAKEAFDKEIRNMNIALVKVLTNEAGLPGMAGGGGGGGGGVSFSRSASNAQIAQLFRAEVGALGGLAREPSSKGLRRQQSSVSLVQAAVEAEYQSAEDGDGSGDDSGGAHQQARIGSSFQSYRSNKSGGGGGGGGGGGSSGAPSPLLVAAASHRSGGKLISRGGSLRSLYEDEDSLVSDVDRASGSDDDRQGGLVLAAVTSSRRQKRAVGDQGAFSSGEKDRLGGSRRSAGAAGPGAATAASSAAAAAALANSEKKVADLEASLQTAAAEKAELLRKLDELHLKLINAVRDARMAGEKASAEVLKKLQGSGGVVGKNERAAPTGLVALCFTDVQDSTALWDFDGDMMERALHLHDSIMRTKIRQHNGYEVKTEGDAFMVAFSNPLDAVNWCLDVQESLCNSDDWPSDIADFNPEFGCVTGPKGERLWNGIRVRMGVHVGTPICKLDRASKRMDYFGPMVNRSARIGGSAHGGQILVSGEMYDLMRTNMDVVNHPFVRSLGEHKLKGLSRPQSVYEVLPSSLKARSAQLKPIKTEGVVLERSKTSKASVLSMSRSGGGSDDDGGDDKDGGDDSDEDEEDMKDEEGAGGDDDDDNKILRSSIKRAVSVEDELRPKKKKKAGKQAAAKPGPEQSSNSLASSPSDPAVATVSRTRGASFLGGSMQAPQHLTVPGGAPSSRQSSASHRSSSGTTDAGVVTAVQLSMQQAPYGALSRAVSTMPVGQLPDLPPLGEIGDVQNSLSSTLQALADAERELQLRYAALRGCDALRRLLDGVGVPGDFDGRVADEMVVTALMRPGADLDSIAAEVAVKARVAQAEGAFAVGILGDFMASQAASRRAEKPGPFVVPAAASVLSSMRLVGALEACAAALGAGEGAFEQASAEASSNGGSGARHALRHNALSALREMVLLLQNHLLGTTAARLYLDPGGVLVRHLKALRFASDKVEATDGFRASLEAALSRASAAEVVLRDHAVKVMSLLASCSALARSLTGGEPLGRLVALAAEAAAKATQVTRAVVDLDSLLYWRGPQSVWDLAAQCELLAPTGVHETATGVMVQQERRPAGAPVHLSRGVQTGRGGPDAIKSEAELTSLSASFRVLARLVRAGGAVALPDMSSMGGALRDFAEGDEGSRSQRARVGLFYLAQRLLAESKRKLLEELESGGGLAASPPPPLLILSLRRNMDEARSLAQRAHQSREQINLGRLARAGALVSALHNRPRHTATAAEQQQVPPEELPSGAALMVKRYGASGSAAPASTAIDPTARPKPVVTVEAPKLVLDESPQRHLLGSSVLQGPSDGIQPHIFPRARANPLPSGPKRPSSTKLPKIVN